MAAGHLGLRLPPAARDTDDQLLGAAALGALIVAPVNLLAAVAVVLVAIGWPAQRVSTARRRRMDALLDELPLAVELLSVGIHAGAPIGEAIGALAGRLPGPVGLALTRTAEQLRAGWLLSDAGDALLEDLGESVRPLVGVLLAASRDGEPLAPSLERLLADLHAARRRRVEVATRRLSVRLLLPLVACILPAFALLTVAPLAVASLRSLPRHP